jgi:hypothetical protein
MKTLLLGGNTGFWRAEERAYERDVMSGIEAWVFAMDGDHCNTLDATPELVDQYDLIIANTNGGFYPGKQLALQNGRRSGIKWVSLIEGCATDYLTPNYTQKKIFEASDLVNVINRHSLDFFRIYTTARCEYIGIPYPAASIRKKFTPGERCDVWTPSNFYNDRNPCSSVLAALPVIERHGRQCHGFKRKPAVKRRWHSFLHKPRIDPKSAEPLFAGLLNSVVFHDEVGLGDYFKTLSETVYAFVNLDHRYTWARNVLDCAALQIPCIATRSTGHVEDFFPALTVEDEFSVRKTRELLERLYSDEEFYKSCASVPIELLEPLSHENMKRKLLAALDL